MDRLRHVVLMSVVDGYPLSQVKQMGNSGKVFEQIMFWFVKFVEVGLVHCDFNEFNVMVSDEEAITIIDFPQMVSVWHENAEELFNRDRECIIKSFTSTSLHLLNDGCSFFQRRFHYSPDDDPSLTTLCPDFNKLREKFACTNQDSEVEGPLDQELHASGFNRSHREILARHANGEDMEDVLATGSETDEDSKADSEK